MIRLITGGARSGKSSYAEECVLNSPAKHRVYIATMDPGNDAENHARIRKHREDRATKGFDTMECQQGLSRVSVKEDSAVLLECLTNLVANEMFGEKGAGEKSEEEIRKGLDSLMNDAADLVVVTNNLYSGPEKLSDTVLTYCETLASLEKYLAARADEVTELVAGIPVRIK